MKNKKMNINFRSGDVHWSETCRCPTQIKSDSYPRNFQIIGANYMLETYIFIEDVNLNTGID